MKKLLFALVLWLVPAGVFAERIDLVPGLALEFSLPSQRWELSLQPPAFLVGQMLRHAEPAMLERAAARGLSAEEAVRLQLGANEAFVANPQTGSFLLVDFSPLGEGEAPPRRKHVKRSARLAGESLSGEEGYSALDYEVDRVEIEGARSAYRIRAGYRRHGEPQAFTGIVGHAAGGWFYLYYTDLLAEAADAAEMARLLEGVRFVGAAK